MDEIMLDQIAVAGYTILFLFALFMLNWTLYRPFDFLASVLLLIGLGSLAYYHYVKLQTGLDEKLDKQQRNARLVAHSTISIFFLLTFLSITNALFRWYDIFGLISHVYLTFAVQANVSQLFGFIGLLLYFLFACINNVKKTGLAYLQLLGRTLLLIYFAISCIYGIKHLKL